MKTLFAFRKMMIMNRMRSVPNIVMFIVANHILVKDLQTIINKHEMEKVWPRRGTLHLQYQY